MDIKKFLDDGLITVEQIDPAELSPGELTSKIRHAVTVDKTRIVVIDSINGYLNAMPVERYLNLQLHELLAFLNQMGVITIMVLAQQGIVGTMQATVDLTYLSDTVILLRYFEARGVVKQALSVIKKRSGYHERAIREVIMDKTGIHVSQPITGMQGILTGTPLFYEPNPEPGSKNTGT
jgi:circadian clock protein KaiC